MYDYQKYNRYFAQVAGGIEDMGAKELEELGAKNIKPIYRGVYFQAEKSTLYKINYQASLLTRILAPLAYFRCHSSRYLYNKALTINWSDFLKADDSFAVFSNVVHSSITHSHYATLVLKDAIVDQFRKKYGKRPNIDKRDPTVWFNLHIENNRAVLSLDTSGGSLHRRGYRTEAVQAPMQETVAAAAIRMSQWDGSTPFYDLMCGSGTFVAEALLEYCRIPPAFLRQRFGFQALPDYDPELWMKSKSLADNKMLPLPPGKISANDISSDAIHIARANAHNLPYGKRIQFFNEDFRTIDHLNNHVIFCNPPYGIRLKEKENLRRVYKELGDFLKQNCKNSIAFVYAGNRKLISEIRLKPSWKKPLVTGALDGRLVKYEIY
jgi:putative N6-adenine-specific DNA methylase